MKKTKEEYDFEISNRVEEALYGALGTSDCHKVGITGGCGLECWVYEDGRCPVPGEIEDRIETEEEREFHNKTYGGESK